MGKLSYAALAAEAEKTGYGRAPLPQGEYEAVVSNANFKKSKAGNDTFNIEFTITAGKLKGRKAWKGLTLTENSVGIFFQQMNTLGVDSALFAEIEEDEEGDAIVCQEIVENEAHVILVADAPEDYQGQPQTRIKTIRAAGSSSGGRTRTAADEEDEKPQTRAPRRRNRDADEEEVAPPKRKAAKPAPEEPDDEEEDEEEDEPSPPARSRRARPSLPPGV